MAHGTPDYGILTPVSTVYTSQDTAELAVRLGSIDTHDRRGNVIFLEDFEGTLIRWQTDLTGVGAAVDVSTDRARNGKQSCKMTLGQGEGNDCLAYHRQPMPRDTGLGLEASVIIPYQTQKTSIALIRWGDGYQKQGYLRYDLTTSELQLYAAVIGWTAFASGITLRHVDYYFHTFKIVVDFVNNKYIRAIVDHIEYDLSAYAVNAVADTQGARLRSELRGYNSDGENHDLYWDDIIVTRNES